MLHEVLRLPGRAGLRRDPRGERREHPRGEAGGGAAAKPPPVDCVPENCTPSPRGRGPVRGQAWRDSDPVRSDLGAKRRHGPPQRHPGQQHVVGQPEAPPSWGGLEPLNQARALLHNRGRHLHHLRQGLELGGTLVPPPGGRPPPAVVAHGQDHARDTIPRSQGLRVEPRPQREALVARRREVHGDRASPPHPRDVPTPRLGGGGGCVLGDDEPKVDGLAALVQQVREGGSEPALAD
mmetsp:Transcript_6519/g.16036  ORF Transcript_6519/g.16036 Transcript_6519/m.16036 type:complete len:237 (-) Transcript_6519:584-1294(-)